MAQIPTSSTPAQATATDTTEAQALNGVEPGNVGNAQVAANLAHVENTMVASADAPSQVRGVDMAMIKDSAPDINPSALDASAKIQAREGQVQANPALLNVSAKSGPIGYTAMKFGHAEALNKPAAGKTVTVHADAGEQFKVNFDPNAAQLSVRHGDLIFSFNDGSRLVVDHFVMAGNQMPSLILPDGTILAGGVVVAQLTGHHNADDLFNIETAAGPAAGGVAGAGGFTYSDDLGGVIGLLDKLPPIPFTELAFPRPADNITPFVFPNDNTPGPQAALVNIDDESFGFTNGPLTGQITPDFGRDGPGTITLSPNFTADGSLAGGHLTSHGSPITTTFNNNTVTGTDGNGNVIFTIHVNPDGSYEFNLDGQLDHADKTNPDDIINLNFTYVVTDADGDASNGSLIIRVKDDAPIANDDANDVKNNDAVSGNVITGLGNTIAGGTDHLSNDAPNKIATITFNGLTKSFDNLGDLNPDGSITISGQYGPLVIKQDGSYTYKHDIGTGHLTETFTYTLRDYDGDSDPANLVITIDDGIPRIPEFQGLTGDKALDESFDINVTKTGVVEFTNSPFSPSTSVVLGDGHNNGQFFAVGSVGNAPGLHSNGQDVTVAFINGVYTGFTGTDMNAPGAKVFEVTLDKTPEGKFEYHFTQFQNLDHADGTNANDVIGLQFGITAVDADGDEAHGYLQIDVRDDAPTANPDVNHATRTIINYDYSANAPDIPSLVEHAGVPMNSPVLYQQGADKASNIDVTYPTTVTIDRVNDPNAITISGSPVFAFTQKPDGTITNIQLVFGNGVSDPNHSSGPDHATYNMTDAGKLGFFIVSNGTVALQGEGILDAGGNLKPGYSFGITPVGNGYAVTYSGPDGVPHNLPYYSGPGVIEGPQTAARFAGHGFAGFDNDHNYVQGIAGRGGDDAPNVVRYSFEDGPLSWSGNDLDYNDVQFIATIAPSSATVNPIIDGNVITGLHGGQGAGDLVGQDDLQPGLTLGTKVTQVSFEAGAFTPFSQNTGSDAGGKFITLEGEYGTLKMYENGNYTYNYNKTVVGGDNKDVFHYTIVDNDGDTSTTTLTIGLDDNYIPSVTATGGSLNEHDLPGPDTIVRDITISSHDGVSNVALTTDGLPVLHAEGQPIVYTVAPDGKTLTGTVNGDTIFTVHLNDPVTQGDGTVKVPYTFTLDKPLDENGSVIDVPVAVKVTDTNGDVVSTTLPLQVIDDVPVAQNDSLALGNAATDNGNLLANDVFGADGPANNYPAINTVTYAGATKDFGTPTGTEGGVKFVSFDTPQGVIKVFENGNYSFTRPNGSFGEINQPFSYTIKDHDGDISTANVTISGNDNPVIIITPPPPSEPGTINPGAVPATIDEHTLTVPGTDSVTQTITFTAPDGLASIKLIPDGIPSLTVQGQPVTYVISPDGHTLTGSANGQPVLTVEIGAPSGPSGGSYTVPYTFTLLQPLDNPGASKNVTDIPVQFIVTDTDGDNATSTLPLHVIDDVPVATNDSLALGNSPMAAGVNLLANDTFNADGPATAPGTVNSVTFAGATKDFSTPTGTENGVKFVTFDTPQGVVKVFENGEYNFTRTPGSFGQINQQFSYTIKDHDGDISSANVTIGGNDNPVTIVTTNPSDPNGTGPGVIVDEHNLLPLGQSTVSATNAIVFTAPDGIGSFAMKTDGLPALTTANGQPVTYSLGNDGHTLYGSAGGSTVFVVSIQNPSQNPDGSFQALYQFTLVQALMDAGTGKNVKDIPVQFTISDTDGDNASSTLLLRVIDDVPVANNDALNLGTSLSGNGTNILGNDLFNADGPAGGVPGHVNNVTYAGATKDFATPTGTENGVKFVSFTVPEGTLKVFENGEYSFTRANGNGALNQSFSYTIKDSDGDLSQANVSIVGARDNHLVEITSPAVDPSGAIIPEANLLVPGVDVVNNQVSFKAPDGVASVVLSTEGMPSLTAHGQPVSYSVSPDGHTLTGAVNGQTVFTVVLGSVAQQPDGSYRAGYAFTLLQPLDNPGAGQNVTDIPVKFVVTDTDGDNASSHLPLQVIDHVPTINSASREVDETSGVGMSDFNIVSGNLGLSYGADGAADSNPFTLTGLTIDGATTVNQLTSGGVAVSIALINNAYVGTANGVQVFSLSVDAQGNYAYHQFKPLDHNNPNDPNEVINFHVGYTVKDHDGDTASGSVSIAVHDDAPVANPDSNQVIVETREFNVIGGAPDFPSLFEHSHVPETQPALYQQGADKASNVVIDHPTTVTIERIPLGTFTSISGSPVFAVTQKDDGSLTNVKLIFGNGSTDPKYDDTPTQADYTMTDTGKLAFFIIRGGTFGLEHIGAIDSHGNINPGYSFNLEAYGNGYKVVYSGPDGQTHDVPTYDYQDNFESPTAGAAFGGHGFAPADNDHGYVQGLAGRQDGDAANVLRYGFEDGPLNWDGNDLDYNDVQFTVTINPTYVQVGPPVSGNVLPNDKVGLDVISGHSYDTMVTQIALGLGAFVSLAGATNADANGKYVDVQGEYGVLRMHENGEYTYTYNGAGTGGDLTDDFRYTIVDKDGDTSNATTLTIHIADNGQNFAPTTMFSMASKDEAATGVVHDSAVVAPADTGIDMGDPANPYLHQNILYDKNGHPIAITLGQPVVDPADTSAAVSSDGHTVTGHVTNGETNHFVLDAHANNTLTSNGQQIETSVVNGVAHGSVNGQDVFTLSLDDNGHYQFNLTGTIDQAQNGTTLAFGYMAKDGDGAAVEGQLMISVHGDHAAPVDTGPALALHDLISPPVDTVSHTDVAVNAHSSLDTIHLILGNEDPFNGHNG